MWLWEKGVSPYQQELRSSNLEIVGRLGASSSVQTNYNPLTPQNIETYSNNCFVWPFCEVGI